MNTNQTVTVGRRQFIKRTLLLAFTIPSVISLYGSCQAQRRTGASTRVVGGGCDGCEGIYEGIPQQMSWQTAIAPAVEPGERLEISGIIYQLDGKTPAPNIILYVYHTDTRGYYSPNPNATNIARRHGHLRGWIKSNLSGEYKFTTIKPAPYPGGSNPAHIHPIVKEPDKNEYYIDEYVFDDDPILTQEKRSKLENRGGSGIIHLANNGNGSWSGKRDIILGLNIPNYS